LELIEIQEAEFEKDGQVLRYRKVMATHSGLSRQSVDRDDLLIADGMVEEFGTQSASTKSKRKSDRTAAKTTPAQASPAAPLSAEQVELAERLRAWRTEQAKHLKIPPFLILHNHTLEYIAQAKPATRRQLLEVKGVGEAKADKYGEAILNVCNTVG
ncbi:MAG: HRDC domain-containing protein, partial [Acidobacteriota bacterium]|nr:HRDC domain-containing protein [Acidobacteriota bacterium]